MPCRSSTSARINFWRAGLRQRPVCKHPEPRMALPRTGAAIQSENRTTTYYDATRLEVAALVPRDARRVLDVGCGAGGLGRLLQESGHEVTGVELVQEAAFAAREHLE